MTRLALVLALLLTSSCVSLDYDLSEVRVPISAKPAEAGASEVVPFRIQERNTLWVHGLFGQSMPDVVALVAEQAEGYDRIANFRVSQVGTVGSWFETHLTLTLIRSKRVVIEGELVRD